MNYLRDIFSKDYFYHAGALTYNFLMVMSSLIFLLLTLASYLPFLDYDRVQTLILELSPKYADRILKELSKIYKNRHYISILSVIIAFYYSVGFSKSLYSAFCYIIGIDKKHKMWDFWIKTAIFIVLLSFFIFTAFSITHLIHHSEILPYLSLFMVYLLLYRIFFPNKPSYKNLAIVSLLLAGVSFLVNKLFSAFMVKLIKLNPLYGTFGSALVFLVLVYYSFVLILFFGHVLYLLDQKEKET